jgi:hypothetical protein
MQQEINSVALTIEQKKNETVKPPRRDDFLWKSILEDVSINRKEHRRGY